MGGALSAPDAESDSIFSSSTRLRLGATEEVKAFAPLPLELFEPPVLPLQPEECKRENRGGPLARRSGMTAMGKVIWRERLS